MPVLYKVERHKRGWAIVRKEVGGYMDGMKTVLEVAKDRKQAETIRVEAERKRREQ